MKTQFTLIRNLMAILILLSGQAIAQDVLSFTEDQMTGELYPERMIMDGGNEFVEIDYHFPGATVTRISHEDTQYQQVTIEGFSHMANAGKPALPAHNDHVAVPLGADVKIVILSYEYTEMQGYQIYPALQSARDTYGAEEPEFEIDRVTYSTNAFYPANPVEIVDKQTYKDCPLAVVQIRPVQFNPVTGTIRTYSDIKYRIEFTGGGVFGGEFNKPSSNKMIRNIVLNPVSLPRGAESDQGQRSIAKDYIIITHSSFLAAADSLANWKRQLGYSVEVVAQSSWTSQQVKDAIQTRYQNWTPHPQYFVILGDHAGSYAIPGEIHYDPYYSEPFATDLYYACMDGAGDHYPDMAHGRISVSSPAQAMDVVMKNINYERSPANNSDFFNNALNCAQYQDDDNNGYADRRFLHTSEEIRDYVMAQGYGVNRVYYTSSSNPTYYNNGFYSPSNMLLPAELREPGFDWSGSHSDITSNINAGKFYVFHRDHGYVGGSGWSKPYYTTSTIPNLTNGDLLPVVFSINCHTGEYQLSECFAEKFIRHPGGGAVGVVAAAYYSFSGYNDGLSCGMIDAIWSNPGLVPNFGSGGISNPSLSPHSDIYSMGDVVNQGKIRMVETWSGASTSNRYQFELFHYFGDPALRIWTASPALITATVPPTCGETSVTISGCNIADATATAFANGTLLGSTTLSGGAGTITFDPQANGSEVLITISSHNFEPLQQTATVQTGQVIAPVADFTSDRTSVLAGEQVNFTDLSTNSPTSWNWQFQGGTPSASSQQNPGVIYNTAGVYQVSLTASNAAGSSTETKTAYITVTDGQYCSSSGWANEEWIDYVEFNGSRTTTGSSGQAGYQDQTHITYQFDAGSMVSLTMEPGFASKNQFEYWMIWIDLNGDGDFTDAGEAVFSAEKKRSTVTGEFFVPSGINVSTRMRISMSGAGSQNPCDIFSNGEVEDYTVTIGTPAPQPPVADFTADVTTVVAGSTVHFTDLSTNIPDSWSWSFSGGTPSMSSDQNPSVVYYSTGTFDVTLTVSNSTGNDIHTKTGYITVTDTPPPSSYCEPAAIDNSADHINAITIGNNGNVSGQNLSGYYYFPSPAFNFTPGTGYSVTLEPYDSKNRNFWRIWIDFNNDGDFDDSDETILTANNKKGTYSDIIDIPAYANGFTRMRISMETGSSPGACDDGFPGEVEDYDVSFGAEVMTPEDHGTRFNAIIYPNPASDIIHVSVTRDKPVRIRLMNMTGQVMVEKENVRSSADFDVSGFYPGIYIIRIDNEHHAVTRKFSKR